mgnify:CR=1 FL=1
MGTVTMQTPAILKGRGPQRLSTPTGSSRSSDLARSCAAGVTSGLPLFLQPKLAISQPGDPYEQEADRVAEQVMQMPDPEFPSSQQDGGIERQVDSTHAMLHRMASPTESESGLPYDEDGQCSGWRKDPQSLSKRAAETYVQLHRTPPSQATVERIECEPPLTNGNYGCTVYFSDGIVIRVIVREADIVVGTAPLQTMTPPSATPLCFFSYACPDGELVLTVKECRSAKPVAPVGTATMVQRQCAACAVGGSSCPACEEEEPVTVSRKAQGAAAGDALTSVNATIRSPGQPLSASTRAFFEPRFGQDLSQVRVHTDGEAQQSARDVNALAYTVGSHIAFRDGQYAPQSPDGQRLLAHELTHVVQQSAAPLQLRRKPPYEDEKLDEEQVANVSPASAPDDVLPAEDDIVVWRYINDALKANNDSYFDAWGELQDRRASSRANALDPNLAAAEHYLFARVLSKVAPSFLVADLDMAYGLAKDIGVVPSFTEHPVTESTPFQKKWGITGAFEGSWLADWL